MTAETTKRKLTYLKERIKELEDLLEEKKSGTKITNLHVRTMERLFQLCVETAGNLNQHFLSLKDIHARYSSPGFIVRYDR